jgi:hypothetical protein
VPLLKLVAPESESIGTGAPLLRCVPLSQLRPAFGNAPLRSISQNQSLNSLTPYGAPEL